MAFQSILFSVYFSVYLIWNTNSVNNLFEIQSSKSWFETDWLNRFNSDLRWGANTTENEIPSLKGSNRC